MATKTKRAVLTAAAVNVTCPRCGAEYPSSDNGSDMWLPGQVLAANGKDLTCVSCDEPFRVSFENRVGMQA